MEVDVYLCVEPDGTECICNERPKRYRDWAYENASDSYIKLHPITDKMNHWVNVISSTDYGYCGFDYEFDYIELPKGTIKKLTGISLSWNDEPLKLNTWLRGIKI